jgi:hypothetical protein
MLSSGMLRRVALVSSEVLEELSASFIGVTRIGELGTTLAVTNNRNTLMMFLRSVLRLLVTTGLVPPKRRFLQELHGVTIQKTSFFIVTAVKTSNLIY